MNKKAGKNIKPCYNILKNLKRGEYMDRSSGVLLHISSLPNRFGIGSFGEETIKFAELLKSMGIKYWQTLPFGTVDSCNSPYKSFSAFAGNPMFIDLETLHKKGLLTQEELDENVATNPYMVDFDWLNSTRLVLFKKAYKRINENYKKNIQKFAKENKYWLYDFSLYMTIREKNSNKDWYDWEDEGLKLHDTERIKQFRDENIDDIVFYEFLQYEFFSEWEDIKQQINELGIKIIGDIPIYVSLESSDVWGNPKLFDLDEDRRPKFISGVPPDYFSEDGQLWGNPLYDWKTMKRNKFSWWIKRLENSLKIFDVVRIDHFRAFSEYWAVPAGAKTAKEGHWVDGPKMDFFDHILKKIDKNAIIAEDLGDINDNVRALLKETGFPGMKVIQFGFSEGESSHLPHNYTKNTVAYTGTHDNNTILGWLWEANANERNYALEYCNYHGNDWGQGGYYSESCRAIIRTLWQSVANLVIVPIQDLCGFGSDTKMNKPGLAKGNWGYRITADQLGQIDKNFVLKLNKIYSR